ncbi:MAG: hypothetical protein IKP02_02140 [Paludibacteraceae bacterium]|nr:hypothetical protein [Paludibacteraceae bacterium]
MKKLTTLLMTLMLMSTALWAEETVTVSANSSDISEGLDLKVVAKLFAEAKNLEEFETMLNNPDSAFCNLDLNGDGQVDYLRVVETGEGNKRLIVLQAILAKDIYQDVASIYVEKDEANNVSVQVVGDEYVYGTNYIIEPVYVYRPVIYDWFWSDAWYAWNSPWYWGFYPGWWFAHVCWAHDRYWHHCYAYHHHHHCCSFRPGREVRHGYHDLHKSVTRVDYALAHPERTFSARNEGRTNARELNTSSRVSTRQASNMTNSGVTRSAGVTTRGADANASRTYGSRNTASSRAASGTGTTTRSSVNTASTTRTSVSTTTSGRSNVATTSASHSNVATSSAGRSNVSTSSTSRSSSSYGTSNSRSTSSASYGSTPTRSSYSGTSSYSGGSRSSSSSFSGGSTTRSSGGGFSGGGGRSSGSSGGGRSGATRR